MLRRISVEPWATICADLVGPLTRSKHGCTKLLVIFDRFFKWTELIPLRKAMAEGVIRACRKRIISRYGVPKKIITDNGTQFTSRIFKRFLDDSANRGESPHKMGRIITFLTQGREPRLPRTLYDQVTTGTGGFSVQLKEN